MDRPGERAGYEDATSCSRWIARDKGRRLARKKKN